MVVWTFFGIALLWDWNENWPFPVLWPLLSFPNLSYYLSLLFSKTILWWVYLFFLPCLSLLFFSQLSVKPPQTTTLPCCISFSWGWFQSSCTTLRTSVHSSSSTLPTRSNPLNLFVTWPSDFPYFLQIKPEFCRKELMISAIVSFRSCFCWLYRAFSSSASKNTINLISVLTICWCLCVESSLELLEKCVCYDQHVLLIKLFSLALLYFVF